ncbi:hypothetical protein BC629DRAFT_1739459, partial [Irpex lacteus]
MDSDEIEQRRLELRARIAEHSRCLVEASRELNGLVPSVSLPPELLIKIFTHLIHVHTDLTATVADCHTTAPTRRYGWLRASHVCHRWREVMLGAPQLWATVWMTGPDCVGTMLARSQQMPLIIRCRQRESRVEPSEYTESLSLVLSHLSRVVTLDLINDASPTLLPDGSWTAPLMKELVIRGTVQVGNDTTPSELFYPRLLLNEMPSLEKLKLYLELVWWNFNTNLIKPALRHLTLHGNAANCYGDFVIDNVLDVLRQLPALETVDLRLALPYPSRNPPNPDPALITLPNLRRLRICDSAAACSELLPRVVFPTAAQISLSCTYRLNTEVVGLLSAIRSHLEGRFTGDEGSCSDSYLVRSAALYEQPEDKIMKLECWTTYHPHDQIRQAILNEDETAQQTLPEPLIALHLNRDGQRHLPALYLLDAIPTEAVESLYLHPPQGDWYPEKDSLLSLFLRSPELRELDLGDFANNCIHKLLQHRESCGYETVHAASGPVRERLILPRLSMLSLDITDGATYLIYLKNTKEFLEELVALLKTRKGLNGGRNLEALVLKWSSGRRSVTDAYIRRAFR